MQADERFFYFSENGLGSSAFDEPVHARNICDFRDLHSRRLRIGVIFGCAGIAGAMLLHFPGAPARIQPMQVGRGNLEFGIWNLEFIKTLDAKEPRALLT